MCGWLYFINRIPLHALLSTAIHINTTAILSKLPLMCLLFSALVHFTTKLSDFMYTICNLLPWVAHGVDTLPPKKRRGRTCHSYEKNLCYCLEIMCTICFIGTLWVSMWNFRGIACFFRGSIVSLSGNAYFWVAMHISEWQCIFRSGNAYFGVAMNIS